MKLQTPYEETGRYRDARPNQIFYGKNGEPRVLTDEGKVIDFSSSLQKEISAAIKYLRENPELAEELIRRDFISVPEEIEWNDLV